MYSKVPWRLGHNYCVLSHNAVVKNEAPILIRGLLGRVVLVRVGHNGSWLHAFEAS